MQYVKYQPKQLLRDFVECYFIWHSGAPKATILVDSPPNAFAAIIFNLAGSHSVRSDTNLPTKLPPSFISGQSVKNYELVIDAEIDQVGIVFKPTGLYHLFGLQMFEFTNSREDLNHVLKDPFKDLQEKLYHSPSDMARISLLDEHLLTRLIKVSPDLDGVDNAAGAIIDNCGNVKIPSLISDAFMSRRKFERHFLTRVGLSPKYYARIRRYGYTCMLMAGQRSVNWDQLLYQVGYYDQSHFIKDFKEFSGLSPSQYLQTNNELSHRLAP
jgi:AraC-like DNA-binding protein